MALRILLYIQLLLGLALAAGLMASAHLGDTHATLGIVIAVLALYALRPLPKVPNSAIRVVARFFPLLPLVLGLGFLFAGLDGALIPVHMLLGIITIGLVEMTAAKQKRALRAA